jgi:two-component system sensor histidine kinase KdpD
MVCLASASPRAAELLRRGSRMAGRPEHRLVRRLRRDAGRGAAAHRLEAQRRLIDNIERATELGAQVRRLQARDAVPALLQFARSHGVSHILVGRSSQPWWRHRLGLTFVQRMLRAGDDFDLHVVALDREEEA